MKIIYYFIINELVFLDLIEKFNAKENIEKILDYTSLLLEDYNLGFLFIDSNLSFTQYFIYSPSISLASAVVAIGLPTAFAIFTTLSTSSILEAGTPFSISSISSSPVRT